jgi:uncharacterized protein YkwD
MLSFLSILLFFNFQTTPGSYSECLEKWDKTVLEAANTSKDVSYMNEEEKKVLFFINLVRLDPELFGQTFLKYYVDSAKTDKDKYYRSLVIELQRAKKLSVLHPNDALTETARSHALDLGKAGKIGHNASTGQSFKGRITELKKTFPMVAEVCQYGYSDALSIVIDLLIDQDVEDLGHRRILLNKNLEYAGAAIEKHRKYHYNCVVDMGSGPKR